MSEFHDPDLRHELGQLSGPYPDDNVAFAAWQQRVGQARRRRAVAWTTGVALSLLLGTVGVAALNSPGRHTLVPGKSADTSADVSIHSTTSEVEDSSTTESTEPTTTDSTVVDTTPITEAIDTSAPETAVQATAAAGNGGSNSGPPKQHGPATSAAPGAPAGTATFPSVGGSITVRQDGEHLTVVAVNPAAGFTAEQDEHSGDRVEVTFRSNAHQSQITVRVADGAMKPDISERDRKHDNTVPDSTDGNDHSGGSDN